MEIVVLSKNRTSGSIENFNISFISSFLKIKLLEIMLPGTYNNITGGSFFITGSLSGTHTINIPSDHYTETSLALTVQGAISAAKPSHIYTVTVGSITNLIISSTTETFSLNFTGSSLNIGFSGIYPSASFIAGTSLVNMLYPSHMLLCSTNVRGVENGIEIAGAPRNNVIHVIPLCGGRTNYRASELTPWVRLFTLPLSNFYLAFPDGFPVNMNGAEYAFKLLVST